MKKNRSLKQRTRDNMAKSMTTVCRYQSTSRCYDPVYNRKKSSCM